MSNTRFRTCAARCSGSYCTPNSPIARPRQRSKGDFIFVSRAWLCTGLLSGHTRSVELVCLLTCEPPAQPLSGSLDIAGPRGTEATFPSSGQVTEKADSESRINETAIFCAFVCILTASPSMDCRKPSNAEHDEISRRREWKK